MSNKKKIDEEFKKLEQLICWHEYYKASDNPSAGSDV